MRVEGGREGGYSALEAFVAGVELVEVGHVDALEHLAVGLERPEIHLVKNRLVKFFFFII